MLGSVVCVRKSFFFKEWYVIIRYYQFFNFVKGFENIIFYNLVFNFLFFKIFYKRCFFIWD